MRILLLLALMLLSLPVAAQERILAYHSDIAIQADGSMEVSETITVRAEGNRIRRGLYRDFPTTYRDRYGNRVRVAFEPIEVLRNGQPEPWFTETRINGVRLNTGDDSFLPVPGEHTFTLRYRTTRQLGFFDTHDELYWNVNGLGWDFDIERLSAEVRLPQSVPAEQLKAEAYTGPDGAQGRDYRAEVFAGGARFEATRSLASGEGLTLVLGFPKGLVPEPNTGQRLGWLLQDNAGLLIAGAGLLLLLAFYGWRWQRYGKDPDPGSIFPHYEPPEGESPAGLRFLRRMSYDSRCFAADIIDMAVRGYLSIERDKGFLKDSWSLERKPGAASAGLSDSQRAIAGKLFSRGDRIELKDSNAAEIGGARGEHVKALVKRYQPRYFVSNGGTVMLGLLFSIAYGALAFVVAQGSGVIGIVVLLVLALVAHILFGRLMQAPTVEGRKLLDRIDGLRLYLSVAERDELKALGGPGAAPSLDAERYEALLPFAVALDVEEAWTAKFTAAVGAAAAATAAANIGWYHGSGNISDLGRFSSELGSTLSSTISSSATPPGSSSGGGGGGSSGGGGGGGGGGGR
ncbi:MAG TPA: DUF2207 domain-containing protein [Arenimonas sp.]|nr:DUF2207 domain-containing protein [Arenimonas sp.]